MIKLILIKEIANRLNSIKYEDCALIDNIVDIDGEEEKLKDNYEDLYIYRAVMHHEYDDVLVVFNPNKITKYDIVEYLIISKDRIRFEDYRELNYKFHSGETIEFEEYYYGKDRDGV